MSGELAHLARAAHAVDEHAAGEIAIALLQQQQLDQRCLHRPLEQRIKHEAVDFGRHCCEHLCLGACS